MSSLAVNYSMPNLGNTLTTNAAAKANAADSGSTNSNPYSATNIGSTFLNLLTQELQNQDPTAPMDSTAMVGQMISLNQLDQLMSISQTLSGASSASSNTKQSAANAVSAALDALTAPATSSSTSSTSGSTSNSAAAKTQNAAAVNPYLSMVQPPAAGSQADLAQQQALSAYAPR
jgi:flagellar basal-body rod modification protein FlgD